MELRQLKHFLAVGEEKSITAAARRMNLTQPALSRQIKALEEELDTALLERGAHSISLTPAGEMLMSEAAKLVRFTDAMVEKIKAAAAGEPLRVGYAPSLAGEFIAVAIERFTQLHPRVRVSLYDWSSSEMLTGLATGKLDLIIAVYGDSGSDPIRWRILREYSWHAVMPANHPLAGKKLLQAKDLEGQRLLMFDRDQYPEYWNEITGFFKSRKLLAKVAGEFDGVNSLSAALSAGMGISLLSESSPLGSGQGQRLVSRPIEDGPPRIVVGAGVPLDKPSSAQVLAFIEELKHASREM